MNLHRPVGADLTMTKNFDTAQLRDVLNQVGANDDHKVFYNTGGLQLKNSLSNSIGAKSHGHQQKMRIHKRTQQPGRAPPSNPLRDIQQQLKPEQIRETVLMKKPTQADLRTSLLKHKDKLGGFYKNKNIKMVTEDQLMLGEEQLSLAEPEISPEQQVTLSNSIHNVPDFKNKMAKQVLKAITTIPPKNE